jgi:flagellar biogenesis protein FliO
MAPDFGALLWPIATVMSLLVLLTLVGRYRQRRGPTAFDQSQIRLLATKRLGLQSSLILIEVDGQRFLLAATRASIVPLTPLHATGGLRFPDVEEATGTGTTP